MPGICSNSTTGPPLNVRIHPIHVCVCYFAPTTPASGQPITFIGMNTLMSVFLHFLFLDFYNVQPQTYIPPLFLAVFQPLTCKQANFLNSSAQWFYRNSSRASFWLCQLNLELVNLPQEWGCLLCTSSMRSLRWRTSKPLSSKSKASESIGAQPLTVNYAFNEKEKNIKRQRRIDTFEQ